MKPLTLRRRLKRLQITHTQLAKRLGVNPSTTYRWIHGQRAIPSHVGVFLDHWNRMGA